MKSNNDVYKIALQTTRGISKYIDMYIKGDISTDVYNYVLAQAIRWLYEYNDYY